MHVLVECENYVAQVGFLIRYIRCTCYTVFGLCGNPSYLRLNPSGPVHFRKLY